MKLTWHLNFPQICQIGNTDLIIPDILGTEKAQKIADSNQSISTAVILTQLLLQKLATQKTILCDQLSPTTATAANIGAVILTAMWLLVVADSMQFLQEMATILSQVIEAMIWWMEVMETTLCEEEEVKIY